MNPQITSRLQNALPKHLAAKLVDTVAASSHDKISDIVAATLSSFIEQEERESQTMVEILQREIYNNCLAEIGGVGCLLRY